MVISGGSFRPDVLKPKEVVSLLLDDDEMEKKRELDNLLNIIILLLNSWLQVELFCQICLKKFMYFFHNLQLLFNSLIFEYCAPSRNCKLH